MTTQRVITDGQLKIPILSRYLETNRFNTWCGYWVSGCGAVLWFVVKSQTYSIGHYSIVGVFIFNFSRFTSNSDKHVLPVKYLPSERLELISFLNNVHKQKYWLQEIYANVLLFFKNTYIYINLYYHFYDKD